MDRQRALAQHLAHITQVWSTSFWNDFRDNGVPLPVEPSAHFAKVMDIVATRYSFSEAVRAIGDAAQIRKPTGKRGMRQSPRTVQTSDVVAAARALSGTGDDEALGDLGSLEGDASFEGESLEVDDGASTRDVDSTTSDPEFGRPLKRRRRSASVKIGRNNEEDSRKHFPGV